MKAMKLVTLGKGINILVHSSGRGYLFLDGALVAVKVPEIPLTNVAPKVGARIFYNFGDRYVVTRDVRALGKFRKFYDVHEDNILKREVEFLAAHVPEVD